MYQVLLLLVCFYRL